MSHRARKDVAADHDSIDRLVAKILKHGFDCRKIAVDVVQDGDSHDLVKYERRY
jgi:hypothetical protein